MRLQNKVALVTGSSAGIGAAIAEGMAAEGADLVVNYCSDKQGAEKTAGAVGQMGRKALVVQADVGRGDDVGRLFDEIRRNFGRLDVLVNNAAVKTKKPFEETDEEDWDRIIDTNLKGVFLCCRQAMSMMPSGGAVLNISSIHAAITTYNFAIYAASKGGMEALTRNLAVELAEKGIRVNALRVGWVAVQREPFGPEDPTYDAVCARIPIHRVGQVEDVVPAAVHLCCAESGFTTGAILPLDGGAGIMVNSPFSRGFVDGGARQE